MKKVSFDAYLLCANIILVIAIVCLGIYKVNNGGFYKETPKELVSADSIVGNNEAAFLTPYVANEEYQGDYSSTYCDPSCMSNLRKYSVPDGTTIYMVDARIDGSLVNIQIIDEETTWTLKEAMEGHPTSIEFVVLYSSGNKLPLLLMSDKD